MMHALDSEGRVEAIPDEDYEPDKPKEAFGIILNKVDLVTPKDRLLEMADDLGTMAEQCIAYYMEHKNDDSDYDDNDNSHDNEMCDEASLEDLFPHIFYTNALAAEGTDDVLRHLLQLATPCQVWAVEAGQPTMMSPLERIEEIIREKIYRRLHKEIPHAVKQVNRLFVRRGNGIVELQQDLVVKSKSHHSIIAGRNIANDFSRPLNKELERPHCFPEK
jgi:GTP-binding protein Era